MNTRLNFKKHFLSAFTMVEVVVAIGVLSMGVLAIVSFFAVSSSLTRLASDQSIASNLAQGYIDKELSLSYDESQVGQTSPVQVSNDPDSPLSKFSEQTEISLINADLTESATDVGLKKIQVTIFYQEGNQAKNVILATIKTKK